MSLVVGTMLACGTIREDEFLCENAVSHLQECCPDSNVSIACNYEPGCDNTTYPDLDSTQSNCILAESCDTLRQNGVCEGAAQLGATGLSNNGGATAPVCTQPAMAVDAGPPPAATVGVGCTSASDCTVPGQMCCIDSVSFDRNCVSTSACPLQACLSTSECGPGMVCGVIDNIAAVCIPADASTAIPDAQSTTPDATDAQSENDGDVSDGGFTPADAADALSDAPVDAGGE